MGGSSFRRCIINGLKIVPSVVSLLFQLSTFKYLNVDLIYSNSSLVWVGIYLSALLRKRHIWHIREFGKADYNITFLLPKRVRIRIIRQSSAIVAISKVIQKKVLKDIPQYKVRQIYNGVVSQSNVVEQARTLGPNQTITFCMLSGLFPDKGHTEAIQAFDILRKWSPKIRLIIAGDGNSSQYINRLKQLVSQRMLDDFITFLGYIDEPNEVYQKSDILLVCSRNEGMGRVTIEAMGQGLPVIGYDAGGTPELISHESNGLLYQGGENQLATAMQRLSTNHDLYHRCSQSAICTVNQHFTRERYTRKVYQLLQEQAAHTYT